MALLIAGVDEAGRGPLVGSVFAAAVILPAQYDLPGLTDSKKLSEKKRDALAAAVKAQALAWCVASAGVDEIVELNILHATMLAMRRAVQGLRLKPTKVLVDGNRIPELRVRAEAIVQGDAKVAAISAASIVAKVTRDRWCRDIERQFPGYGFERHKGYGTAEHLQALRTLGATPYHRRSFAPVAMVLRQGAVGVEVSR